MKQQNTIKIAALTAAIITLSACGGSTTGSAGTPAAGPSNGTITVNFKWPANTQTKAAKALPPCTYQDKNDPRYSFNYSLGNIMLLSSNQVQAIHDNSANDGIKPENIDKYQPHPQSVLENMPTNTGITISERDNSVNVIPPPQCGTSTGHWTFSPNQVTLTNGEHTTITATFVPNQ